MSAMEAPRHQTDINRPCWRSGHVLGDLSLPQIFAELVAADHLRSGDGRRDPTILRGLTWLQRLNQRAHDRASTWEDALQVGGLLEAYSSKGDDLDAVIRETLRYLSESDPAINDLISAWQNAQPNRIAASAPTPCEAA